MCRLFYFPEVKRHITEELVLAWIERNFIIRYAISNYWWVLLVVFVLMFLTIKYWFYSSPFKKITEIFFNQKSSIFIGVALLVVIYATANTTTTTSKSAYDKNYYETYNYSHYDNTPNNYNYNDYMNDNHARVVRVQVARAHLQAQTRVARVIFKFS